MFSQNAAAVVTVTVTDAWPNRLLFGLNIQQDMRPFPPYWSITYIVADYMPLISSS